MAEWQTHQTQNLAVATPCGFKSRLRHQSESSELVSDREWVRMIFFKTFKDGKISEYGREDANFPREIRRSGIYRINAGERGHISGGRRDPAAKGNSFRENYFAGEFAYTGILLYTYCIKRPF